MERLRLAGSPRPPATQASNRSAAADPEEKSHVSDLTGGLNFDDEVDEEVQRLADSAQMLLAATGDDDYGGAWRTLGSLSALAPSNGAIGDDGKGGGAPATYGDAWRFAELEEVDDLKVDAADCETP